MATSSSDSVSTDLVPVARRGGGIPIANLRHVYRCDEVERRLTKLPPKEHESLRSTYERMLEKGSERFQVKPSGLPAMDHLYDELPNFHDALDDIHHAKGDHGEGRTEKKQPVLRMIENREWGTPGSGLSAHTAS